MVVAGGDLDVRAADLVRGRGPGDEAGVGSMVMPSGCAPEAEGDRVALGVLGLDLVDLGHATTAGPLGCDVIDGGVLACVTMIVNDWRSTPPWPSWTRRVTFCGPSWLAVGIQTTVPVVGSTAMPSGLTTRS